MPRPILFLIILLVVVVGLLYLFSTLAAPVDQQVVETNVTNAAGE